MSDGDSDRPLTDGAHVSATHPSDGEIPTPEEAIVAGSLGATILVEQFRTLREEILMRIRHHVQLVTFKVATLGVIFSVLFEPTKLQQYSPFLWVIPLTAAAFDLLIAGNLRSVYNMSEYIRDHIEPHFKLQIPSMKHFWEESVFLQGVDKEEKYRSSYQNVDMVVIWLVSLIPSISVFYLRKSAQSPMDYREFPIWLVSGLAVAFALYFLLMSIKRHPRA